MGWSTGTALTSNGPTFTGRPLSALNSNTSLRSVSASSTSLGAYSFASRLGALSGACTGSLLAVTS